MPDSVRSAAPSGWSSLFRYARTPKGLVLIVLAILVAIASLDEGVRLVAPGLVGAAGAAMLVDAPILRFREDEWLFPDGALITGLMIAMILSPREPWYVAAVASVLAVLAPYREQADKYIITIQPEYPIKFFRHLLEVKITGFGKVFYPRKEGIGSIILFSYCLNNGAPQPGGRVPYPSIQLIASV